MLSLLLTATDGGTEWRHLLRQGEARAGWEVVGPLGLARRLGRVLGIPAEPTPAPERVAAYGARLAAHDDGHRSYSASRREDPFGVAAFLLALRDRLRAAGWDGTALAASPRLADVATVEAPNERGVPAIPPGRPDIERELARRIDESGALPELLAIELAAPREAFTRSQRDLLEALAAAGATVTDAAADGARAPVESDLGRLQRALLDGAKPPRHEADRPRLAGDGSVLILEADTPAEAAELVASLCRDRSLSATTFVAPSEPSLLDAALRRQGLATLGVEAASRWRPALQILPLRLALAFRPRDPLRAAELLLLPVSPLARHARHKLLTALSEMPGLWGPAWNEAVDEACAEEGRRTRERARESAGGEPDARALEAAEKEASAKLRAAIEIWYGGETFDPQGGIPAAKAGALCEAVAAWASAHAALQDPPDAQLLHAAAVARTLLRLLAHLSADERLTRIALEQLHDTAVGDGLAHATFDAEAGRPALCGEPAVVLPAAAELLWWGFVGDGAAAPPEQWTEAERAALAAAGLDVGALGAARALEAWGWRRPVLAASERLVLVRWRLSGCEAVPRHALEDEIATRLAPGSLDACVVDSRRALSGTAVALGTGAWKPRLSERTPAPSLAPRAVWNLPPATIVPEGSMSPSSIERLFNCPIGWVLEQRAELKPGRVAQIPEGPRLRGSFGHAILEDMLVGNDALDLATSTPSDAADWAGRAFDARVESEAAPLVLAGRDVERALARRLMTEAASALLRILKESGWRAKAVEEEAAGDLGGTPVHGRVDLVIERGGAPGVIDLKLGRSKERRDDIERGRAIQLAIYSAMLRRGGDYPPTGYFILDDGQLLTTTPGAFALATEVDGPSTQETVERVKEGLDYWKRVLAAGTVPATHKDLDGWQEPVAEAVGEEVPDEGPAAPEPVCRYCKFKAICTMRIGAEATP